jgi:hypothetical protein
MFTCTFCNFIVHNEKRNNFVSFIERREQCRIVSEAEVPSKPENRPFAHGMIQPL